MAILNIQETADPEKNCTRCKHFCSWQSLYDGDEYEPWDSGKCDKDDDVYVSLEKVCELFEKIDEQKQK